MMERQWLVAHPVIRFAPDPEYQPIESIDEFGHLVGISADYLKLLENKLGISFKLVPVSSWDQAMSMARSREVDMLSAATKSSARSKFMLFTTPHIELPGVIIVQSKAGDYSSLKQFGGKKVGVVSGYVWQEWIARDYPAVNLQPVRDVQTGLLLVSFGQLDAMVANVATATHFLEKLGITNLRVAGETGYFARLGIATRNDWPELNAILQKAVSAVGAEEMQAIRDRWIRLKSPLRFDDRTILWGVLILLAVVTAAVGGNLFWNYSLRQMVHRQNRSLRESEERFRAIVEDQTEFIGRSLPHVHTLTFVNEAYCRYFGKTREELIGTSFLDHIPEEERSEVDSRLAALSVDNPVVQVEHRSIAAAGVVRWHRWSDRAIFDAQNNIVEIQAVGRDITDQKRAEDRLRDSEARYRQLIETSPDAILVTRENRTIAFVNSAAIELFGAESADQLIGRNMLELVHPDHRESVDERRREVFAGRLPPIAERKRLRLDGSEFLSESRGVPITWEGDPAILIIIRDITERRLAEEQLRQAQKMQAIGQLTGGVAHDFNNLLTIILGNSELLKRRLDDDHDVRLVDSVLGAAKRGDELIQRMLAFSRRQTLSPTVIDLGALVDGVTDMLRPILGETIRIESKAAAHLWPVEVDAGQLENALINLAINGRDAMADGGWLTLETANVHLVDGDDADHIGVAPGDYVSLSVTDTGSGMAPEVLEHVFEPFYTTKEVGEGSGLGLSMVYGFVAQSGGGIEIDSEQGRGTKITLFLARADEAGQTGEADADSRVGKRAGSV